MRKLVFVLVLISQASAAQEIYLSSGVYHNISHLKTYNSKTGSLADYNGLKTGMDLSLLIKIPVRRIFSLKTGFYTHVENFNYERYYKDMLGGHINWEGGMYKFQARNIDFPLLLSLNSFKNFHFDIGPYAGFGLFKNMNSKNNILKNGPQDLNLKNLEYGINFSAGAGGNKTQISAYLLYGLSNLIDDPAEKGFGYTIGINITRIFNLKKKKDCFDPV